MRVNSGFALGLQGCHKCDTVFSVESDEHQHSDGEESEDEGGEGNEKKTRTFKHTVTYDMFSFVVVARLLPLNTRAFIVGT